MRCTIVLAAFETIWLPVVNQPDFNDRDLSSIRIVMTVGVTERLRDMARRLPDAILKEQGITRAPKIETAPAG